MDKHLHPVVHLVSQNEPIFPGCYAIMQNKHWTSWLSPDGCLNHYRLISMFNNEKQTLRIKYVLWLQTHHSLGKIIGWKLPFAFNRVDFSAVYFCYTHFGWVTDILQEYVGYTEALQVINCELLFDLYLKRSLKSQIVRWWPNDWRKNTDWRRGTYGLCLMGIMSQMNGVAQYFHKNALMKKSKETFWAQFEKNKQILYPVGVDSTGADPDN